MDFDMDNPHGTTLSVTTNTENVLACTTKALPSPHEGPAIGRLHTMHPNPHLELGIEAETINPASISCENPVPAHCSSLDSLHMMHPTPCLGFGIKSEATTPTPFFRETQDAVNCLHMMLPNPHLRLSIEDEATIPTPFSTEQ